MTNKRLVFFLNRNKFPTSTNCWFFPSFETVAAAAVSRRNQLIKSPISLDCLKINFWQLSWKYELLHALIHKTVGRQLRSQLMAIFAANGFLLPIPPFPGRKKKWIAKDVPSGPAVIGVAAGWGQLENSAQATRTIFFISAGPINTSQAPGEVHIRNVQNEWVGSWSTAAQIETHQLVEDGKLTPEMDPSPGPAEKTFVRASIQYGKWWRDQMTSYRRRNGGVCSFLFSATPTSTVEILAWRPVDWFAVQPDWSAVFKLPKTAPAIGSMAAPADIRTTLADSVGQMSGVGLLP